MTNEPIIVTPLDPSYKYNVNVRPIKFAYFFKEGDKTALERILRLVSTQWGGLNNLIIPVPNDLQISGLFKYLLKLHEPDRFVGYLHNLKQKRPNLDFHNKFQAYLNELWQRRIFPLEVGGDFFEKQDRTAHPLGIIPNEILKNGSSRKSVQLLT